MRYRIGVDIGGTFADFVALDEESRIFTLKVSTTPHQPGGDVIEGLRRLKELYDISPTQISYFTHGTTVGVNGLIQRQGARLCLLVTEGFEDVLELGRLKMPDVFCLYSKRPDPLVARASVFPVRGRLLADGSVAEPIDLESVDRAVEAARTQDAECVVVALLHSYRNPEHEQAVAAHIADRCPDLLVTCSHQVWPEIREYERTVTAAINAFVQPRMAHYIASLQDALRQEGVKCELQIAKSNGGVMRAELAKKDCVSALLSGTASGVMGASFVSRLSGFRDIATIDIGGTSADVAIIRDGKPSYGIGQVVGDFSLHAPAVKVDSIGGGGGSIAWVDEHGILKSGPRSAGSRPGPACYGRGGTEPATTDAYLVTGFLGQANLAYGSVSLDRHLAEAAIGTLARRLNRSILETAEAIIEVAVSGMYAEMTRVLSAQGVDPATLALLAFGGAGPMMACWVAREVGIRTVVIPPTPGVLSALGGLVTDSRNDFVQTVYEELDPSGVESLGSAIDALAERAKSWLRNEQNYDGAFDLHIAADMRYEGQGFELETTLDPSLLAPNGVDAIASLFHAEHERTYGHHDPEALIRIINARVTISARNPKPDFPTFEAIQHNAEPLSRQTVYCDGREHSAGVYSRTNLRPGANLEGPAIILQDDTTTCVLPGFRGCVDGQANLILETIA